MRALLALVSTLALAACNMAAEARKGEIAEASGSGTQRSYRATNFDSVSLGGHHNVVIQVGPAHSVRAEGDESELDRLEIRTDNGRLHIGTKRGSNWSFNDSSDVTVFVTLPALTRAAIGGSGDMKIDAVQGRSFDAAIGGSGNMEIGSLQVDEAAFSIAGSGNIRARGAAGTARVKVAGSGDVDASAVESRTADVSVLGSGDVRVRASQAANVSIMGSGDVTVGGEGRCSVKTMGSGEVRCSA
jgi:hypothetical protein